ncbi:hypothetical protein [Rubripirellula obstinata]|uniref:hypothetical protein n=1 Tax=Rubripirellula obstinata TaxID=406547 RepID=UPI001F39006D|nr:hypothetical protein [Rubripirellula obstinata]
MVSFPLDLRQIFFCRWLPSIHPYTITLNPDPHMARKVVSRKAKAAEAEAAEKLISDAKAKKKAGKRTKKSAADLRLRLYWGVFSQNLKRVAVFEFDQKADAEKRAVELSKGGKSPHFVQKVKEEIKPE